MTAQDVAAAQGRHVRRNIGLVHDIGFCFTCKHDWPCDAALLLKERERLVAESSAYMHQGITLGMEINTLRADLERCRALIDWIRPRTYCASNEIGNEPCHLNKQPDTHCFYHKMLEFDGTLTPDAERRT